MPLVNDAVTAQGPQPAAKRQLPPEVMRVVIAAKKILAQPQIAQQMVAMMKAAGDPAKGIAQAVVFLMKQLVQQSKGFPKEAFLPAAQEVISDVVKLGVSAKLFQFSPELVQQAAMQVIQMLKAEAASKQQAQQPPVAPVQAPVQAAAPTPGAAPVQPPVQTGV